MSYQITGSVSIVSGIIQIGEKQTDKRTLVIQIGGEYPKSVAFDVFGKNCENLEFYRDKSVTIDFDVRSNQSKTDASRWFTSAKIINITETPTRVMDVEARDNDTDASQFVEDQQANEMNPEQEEDDVPF